MQQLSDLDRRAALVIRRCHRNAKLHRIRHHSTSVSEGAGSVTTFAKSRYEEVKNALAHRVTRPTTKHRDCADHQRADPRRFRDGADVGAVAGALLVEGGVDQGVVVEV